jgi:hypothetical protein
MNERIRQLAEQADWRFSDKITGDELQPILDKRLEEFAELIVRECMSMSDELKAQYLTSRKSTMDFDEKNIYAEGEAACDVLKYKMKKHFGVKE